MADVAGQPRPDLSFADIEPAAMDAFTLLRRLERDGLRFGGTGPEPARLGQRVRLGFATVDIARYLPPSDSRSARVEMDLLGLLGPEGAMPLSLTRRVMSRLSDRWFTGDDATADTSFLDFCNMLQHRMLALYARGWIEANPAADAERGGPGRIRAMLKTLAGTGLPGLEGAGATAGDPDLALRHATSLASQVNGPERLTRYLADLLQMPVALVEFVGDWIAIPPALRTRLGTDHAGLGTGAVLGLRSFQRQTRAELRIGPMDLERYDDLSADPRARAVLRRAILFAAGADIEFDLRLVLRRDQVPAARPGACHLGRTAWLEPGRRSDAGDYHIRGFSARPESEVA